MMKRLLVMMFVVVVGVLLVWQRLDTRPQQKAVITASTASHYQLGDTLKRGQTVQTNEGERVAFRFGDVHVGLAEKTSVELHRLYEDERVLNFPRGRIVVENKNEAPVFVDTMKTQNTVTSAKATFINFDFLQTVHIIPLVDTVQTTLVGSNEFMLLPVPIAVNESATPTYQPIEFNIQDNAAVNFYQWFDSIVLTE